MIDHLEGVFRTLAANPGMGHVRGDLWPDAMCFVAFKSSWRSRFLVFYRTVEGGIEIARVLEGHQDISRDWFP